MKKSPQKTKPPLNRRSEISSGRLQNSNQSPTLIPEDLFNKLPIPVQEALRAGKLDANIKISQTSVSSFQSNIPPVEFFYAFEEKFPGWGVRLLEMTERQGLHRQQSEKQQIDSAEKRMNVGQLSSFLMAGLGIVASAATLILERNDSTQNYILH